MSIVKHHKTAGGSVRIKLGNGYSNAPRGEAVQAELIFPHRTDATLAVTALQNQIRHSSDNAHSGKVLGIQVRDADRPNIVDAEISTRHVVVPPDEATLPPHIRESFRICRVIADFVFGTITPPESSATEPTSEK